MELSYKTRYWLLSLLMLLSVTAWSQQKNVLSISDAKVSIGDAQLPVAIENTDEIVAVQFDLTLPSTISAGTEAVVTNRCDGHTVIIRNIEATRYRVMLYSDDNRPLIAQQGTVLYVPLNIPQTVADGSELPLVISNATLTVASGENVLTETKTGKLIVSMLPDLTVMNIAPSVQGDAEALTITPGDHLSLSWQVQNVGEAATKGGWSEQIMVVNKRGTVTKLIGTVYQQEILAAGAVMSRQADIIVPQLLGLEGDAYVQVHIVATSETGESTLAAGNNTAQSEDVFTVSKRLFVEPNPIRIVENSTSRVAVKVSRSGDWNTEQTFMLSTNGDTRVTLPSQVTMPIGQSGAIVYMTVRDNSVLDDDDIVMITAKGNGYADAQGELTIEDNEYPNLTLTTSKSAVTEGETFQLTVTTSRVPKEPVIVTLASENAKRFTFPQTATIPAGETSVTVDVEAVDDNNPGVEIDNAFTASAFHYNKAEVYVLLQDNDMPTISLSLSPTTLTESAGPVAMMAVLRRTSHVDQDITVKLSDKSQYHDINYGQFSSISMAKGVEEVSFSLGVNDNLNVDGDRDVTITAAVYIQSCSCSAANEGAGVVSQMIHIIDNDGPSLSMTSSRSMLLEGAEEATVLTISRNTPVTQALTISISSNYDEGLEFEHSVVIPAGKREVKVPVKALTNLKENDSHTITFTATAEGHSDGTCWAMISDQTLPDAIVKSVELLRRDGEAIGKDGVMVNDWVQACITVENVGVINLPAALPVNVYVNSKFYTSLITSQAIAPGESAVLTCNIKASDKVGTLSVYANVNEDKSVHELLYANNTSPTTEIKIRASFTATVSVDKNVLHYGESVTISGRIARPDGIMWETDGQTTVQLYIIADGQRFVESVKANESGEFSYVWTPTRYQIGHIGIGACYPGEALRDEMASVDIYGMRHTSANTTTFYTVIDQPYNGKFSIVNPGRLPLTGLTVTIADNPDGADVIFNAPERIEGGETIDITYTLTGRKVGGNNDWQIIKLNISTAEGPELNKSIYYYTRNKEALLSCSVQQINTTMTKGTTRDYMFNVSNIGMGGTGVIALSIPNWMQSITPINMAPLEPGDTTQVVLRFLPTDDMQLNVPVAGQIGINCENGNGIAIPFKIEPVSESTGNLIVDVCDEYTYYTDEAPHVSGATVSVLHPITGAVVARDVTNSSGIFATTLPEGYYTLLVTHSKHNSYRVNFQLDPGKTTNKVVNLTIDAIEVSWDVVETTVEDTYEIVTSVKYETNVPAPVVTVSVPDYVPAKELAEGESLVFYAALTNVGLITAKGVEFEMPNNFNVLVFEPLDFVGETFELAPQQSVVIPVKVTNSAGVAYSSKVRRIKHVDNDPCYAKFPLSWFYECGTDSVYHKYPTGIQVGDCEGKSSVEGDNDEGSGGGDDGLGIGGWYDRYPSSIGRPNYPSLNLVSSTDSQQKVSTGEPYKCQPCSNSSFIALAKLFGLGPFFHAVEKAADVYNCVNSAVNNDNWHDRFAGCKYTESVVNSFDKCADKIVDLYENYEEMKVYGQDLANHVREDGLFTQDCMDDLKNIYDALFEMGDDVGELAENVEDLSNRFEKHINDTKDFYNELKETRDIVKQNEDENFRPNDDVIRDRQLDKIANGETSLSREKQEMDILTTKEELYVSLDRDIASEEDYLEVLKGIGETLFTGKKPNKEETRRLTKPAIKVFSDILYNSHDYACKDLAKEQSFWRQSATKNAYIENTDKLVGMADDIADALHYTFGDCEYEGADDGGNSGNEDEHEEGENANGKTRLNTSKPLRKATSIRFNQLPYSYKQLLDKLDATREFLLDMKEMETEFFGSSEWAQLNDVQITSLAWAMEQVKKDETAIDNPNIYIYCPEGISDDLFRQFLVRYASSLNNVQITNGRQRSRTSKIQSTSNSIDLQHIEELKQSMNRHLSTIMEGERVSISNVLQKYYDKAYEDLSGRSSTVCASITLQFNQTMTMTRQAFRGTLKVHNGNTEESMKDIVLELEVRNANDGSVATSREMQMNVESLDGFEGALNFTDGWTLEANGDGTATILFIPSKYAAPTEPVDYTFGGRLKYLDPFTGLMVTRELSPVTLTVKPSPELDLTYFMQRDVYGDDPLTLDVVEAMEPAEFALLVNNKGYGDATNVKMLTQQPEITENEKGLLIAFELISSQVNGGDATLSFGQSIANDFGTIPAHSQLYAQWWLTSTLLGHFTEYDVQATHVTSYGNPDLSLLDQVTIHELIHGFDMPNGSLIGGPEKGRAFLVNDIVDANDLPDKLYFTNGDTAGVVIATTAKIERTSPTTCLLTVTPSAPGWNYGNLLDPTYGYAELKSIVRQSDGQELGNTRFWQTDRTLRDGKDWLYEYRLHFVDEFNTGAPVTYLLTFDPVPEEVLEVASIDVVPEEGKIAEEPIETLTVTFNKPVDASTFTSDDITLAVQGAKQDVSTIGISTNDNKSFVLDMKTVNPQLGNGYYTLTVQTAGITDWEGFQGRAGKQVGWIMFRGGLVQLLTSAWPKNAGSVMRKPDEAAGSRRLAQTNEDINDNTAEYGSTVTLVAVAEEGYEFTNWTLNGEVVSTDVELETTALGDMNVVANFAKKKYMVNVTVEGTGGTTAGTATGIYEYETEISVTAVPDEDFALENWTVNGKAVEGSGNMLTVTVDKPLDVQASFLQEYFYQRVTLDKGWNWISAYLSEPWAVTDWSRYTNRIMGQTDEAVNDPETGMTGSLSELMSGQAYKVEANSRFTNTLRGHLYNTAVSPINLRKGWNWVAFPYMNGATMDVVTTAEEGDFIASQKGFAEYVDGAWTGTLDMFIPGEGYLYKSTSEKSLAFDKSKLIDDSSYGGADADITEQDVDIRRYPSTMNMTARICRDESEELGEGYSIYAMVGDELRGVSQHVSGKHYLTVYGDEAADVTFFVESAETGETFEAHETLAFRDDVVGSSKSPFTINIGEVTGIDSISSDGKMTIYTVEGVLVSQEATMKTLLSLPKGVYIINGKKRFIR